MKIKKHYDDFTGTTYTVMLADGVSASFSSVLNTGRYTILVINGIFTLTMVDDAAERFLTEWQRFTGEVVRTPVNAEEF